MVFISQYLLFGCGILSALLLLLVDPSFSFLNGTAPLWEYAALVVAANGIGSLLTLRETDGGIEVLATQIKEMRGKLSTKRPILWAIVGGIVLFSLIIGSVAWTFALSLGIAVAGSLFALTGQFELLVGVAMTTGLFSLGFALLRPNGLQNALGRLLAEPLQRLAVAAITLLSGYAAAATLTNSGFNACVALLLLGVVIAGVNVALRLKAVDAL